MSAARFRADPAKVRVGIRQRWHGYVITVESRIGSIRIVKSGVVLTAVVDAALEAAESAGMSGIDIGMQWAYDHPHRLDA